MKRISWKRAKNNSWAAAAMGSIAVASFCTSACTDNAREGAAGDAAAAVFDAEMTMDASNASQLSSGISASADGATLYSVVLVPGPAGLHQGKNEFQLRVSSASEGTPVTGIASEILLFPLMIMPAFSHGNPVPVDAVKESATPGTYDCTLFFSMPSVDKSGMSMGQWTLTVGLPAGQSVKLDMTVEPPAGPDTTNVGLKNRDDTFSFDGGPRLRNYLLFRDTLEPDPSGGYAFGLFAATVQEGMLTFPPLTVGLRLTDPSNTTTQMVIESYSLQASTDAATWLPMACDATSRCRVTLAGLLPGTPANIFVKLNVNGKDYTTDGQPPIGVAPDGDIPDASVSNSFATFLVTPPAP